MTRPLSTWEASDDWVSCDWLRWRAKRLGCFGSCCEERKGALEIGFSGIVEQMEANMGTKGLLAGYAQQIIYITQIVARERTYAPSPSGPCISFIALMLRSSAPVALLFDSSPVSD